MFSWSEEGRFLGWKRMDEVVTTIFCSMQLVLVIIIQAWPHHVGEGMFYMMLDSAYLLNTKLRRGRGTDVVSKICFKDISKNYMRKPRAKDHDFFDYRVWVLAIFFLFHFNSREFCGLAQQCLPIWSKVQKYYFFVVLIFENQLMDFSIHQWIAHPHMNSKKNENKTIRT